jgi:cell division protein FtsL
MKKSYIVIIFLLGLIVFLSVGKAVLQNMLSTSGIFISKVEQEISFYKTQNAVLSEGLLTKSSLTNIAEKARQLGFTDKNTLMVLRASRPLAAKP